MTLEYPKSDPRPGHRQSDLSGPPKYQITSIRLCEAGNISREITHHRVHSCKVRIEEFCQRETERQYHLEGSSGVGAKNSLVPKLISM